MNIYEIKSEITQILNETDENGEITDDNMQKLSDLTIQRVDKLLNLGCLIKNESSDSDAIDNEIKQLRERKRIKDNNIKRLKDWATANMYPKEKIEDARVKLSIRKSAKCVLKDGIEFVHLPDEFVRVKKEIDLSGLTKALKSNNEMALKVAELQDNFSLQIK